MPYLAHNNDGIGVKDNEGNVTGQVTPRGVIAALAATEEARPRR